MRMKFNSRDLSHLSLYVMACQKSINAGTEENLGLYEMLSEVQVL